jgi:hypothetical protein
VTSQLPFTWFLVALSPDLRCRLPHLAANARARETVTCGIEFNYSDKEIYNSILHSDGNFSLITRPWFYRRLFDGGLCLRRVLATDREATYPEHVQRLVSST